MRVSRFLLTCLLLPPAVAAGEDFRLSVNLACSPEEMLAEIPLGSQGEWCLHWHHSVQGFLVRDCFAASASGTLYLDRSYQPDFAAGLDHIPGRGRLESDGRDGYIIERINEPVPDNRLRLRVGSLRVDHRIVTGDHNVSLSGLAAHQSVEIQLHHAHP